MKNSGEQAAEELHSIEWTHHPLSENRLRGILVVLMILILAGQVVYWLGPTAISAALTLVFLYSLRDFFLPSSCRLDGEGVSISSPLTGTRRLGWYEIESHFQGRREFRLHLKDGKTLKMPPQPDSDAAKELNQVLETMIDDARTHTSS